MARIDFDTVPAIGTVVMINHQSYELATTEPYTRRDGTPPTVLVWQTSCPDCGAEFETRSGLKGSSPARRCEQHRRQARVERGRRGGNQITVIPA